MTASKTVRDIALVAAVLPMAIPINREHLPAVRAGIGVRGLVFYKVKMAVPLEIAASVGAEAFLLPLGILCDGLPALLTDRADRICGRKLMPAAPRFYGIDGKVELICNRTITHPVTAHDGKLPDLFVCHILYLLLMCSKR